MRCRSSEYTIVRHRTDMADYAGTGDSPRSPDLDTRKPEKRDGEESTADTSMSQSGFGFRRCAQSSRSGPETKELTVRRTGSTPNARRPPRAAWARNNERRSLFQECSVYEVLRCARLSSRCFRFDRCGDFGRVQHGRRYGSRCLSWVWSCLTFASITQFAWPPPARGRGEGVAFNQTQSAISSSAPMAWRQTFEGSQ
jgi:hypothetical protein